MHYYGGRGWGGGVLSEEIERVPLRLAPIHQVRHRAGLQSTLQILSSPSHDLGLSGPLAQAVGPLRLYSQSHVPGRSRAARQAPGGRKEFVGTHGLSLLYALGII